MALLATSLCCVAGGLLGHGYTLPFVSKCFAFFEVKCFRFLGLFLGFDFSAVGFYEVGDLGHL